MDNEKNGTFKLAEEDGTEVAEDGTIVPKVFKSDPKQEEELKSSQFGYPCEFKTAVFMEPFKFYNAHVDGIKLLYGEDVKLNHRMQVIRTITDGSMLNNEGVELKRTRALHELTQRVKQTGDKLEL